MHIRLFLLLLPALLHGCAASPDATPRQIAVDVPTVVETSFRFIDSSRRSEELSPFVLKPSGPEIVKSWLQQSLSEQLRGKSVRLETFAVGVIRQPRLSMSTHPPALTMLDDALMSNVYFVTIDAKVGEFPFYVHVNDRGNGLIEDMLVRSLLRKARKDLELGAARAARLSTDLTIETPDSGAPADATHVKR